MAVSATKSGSQMPVGDGRDASGAGIPTYTSAELFRGGVELHILHEQAVYRLKITRQGKLILNK